MSSPAFELKTEIVRAGAGAGKTHTLTQKVVNVAQKYLKHSGQLPRVVVTTFTKKATEELRERLLRIACENSDENLFKFITSPSFLYISTIHGVMSLFLKRYGHWLDIDSAFNFIDGATALKLAKSTFRDVIVSDPKYTRILSHFNIHTLVEQLRKLSDKLVVYPDLRSTTSIELVAAADEAFNSVVKNVNVLLQSVLANTDAEIWLDYAKRTKALITEFNVNRPEVWQSLLLEKSQIKMPRWNKKKIAFAEELHVELKYALSEFDSFIEQSDILFKTDEYNELTELFLQMAQQFSIEFLLRKKITGQFEMSDLEVLTLQSIRQHPEMAQAFSTDWDYWLIDEFQDTSPLQVEILRDLVGNRPRFVVGDPQQSIYLFRGARSEVFTNETQYILSKGGEQSQLLKNYRSNPSLLLFFNEFFKQFNTSTEKTFIPMEPKSDIESNSNIIAKFCITDKDGTHPYAGIAQEIIESYKLGRPFEHNCILSRTNAELAEIAIYLESQNIPTHIHASQGYYGRREILDLLSLLKFMVNPHDNINFVRLIRSPWYRLDDSDIVALLNNRPIHYWLEAQNKISHNIVVQKLVDLRSRVSIEGVYSVLMSELIHNGMIDMSNWHDSTGRREANIWKFMSLLKENEKKPGFSYLSFVNKAFQSLDDSQLDPESDAVAVLEPNRVNLMTIHLSKGLKFKHVFTPNLHKTISTAKSRSHLYPVVVDETGKRISVSLKINETQKLTHNFWSKKILSQISEREVEEHLRILYVALTRAEESVFLHWRDQPRIGSLASRFNIDLSEGIHKKAHFSYEVTRPKDDICVNKLDKNIDIIKARDLFNAKHATSTRLKKISVSTLIQDMQNSNAVRFELEDKSAEQLKHQVTSPVWGQKLHSYLEKIKYLNKSDIRSYSEDWFSHKSIEFEKSFSYVLSLEEPPVRDLIINGNVEWGFQLKTRIGIVEGQIDLWGQVKNKSGQLVTWIIDYKSGSSRYSDKAFAQLNLYSLALRELGILAPISLAVIYALENKLEIRQADASVDIRERYFN